MTLYVKPDAIHRGGFRNGVGYCAMEYINFAKAGYNHSVLLESAGNEANMNSYELAGIPEEVADFIIVANDLLSDPLELLDPIMKMIIECPHEMTMDREYLDQLNGSLSWSEKVELILNHLKRKEPQVADYYCSTSFELPKEWVGKRVNVEKWARKFLNCDVEKHDQGFLIYGDLFEPEGVGDFIRMVIRGVLPRDNQLKISYSWTCSEHRPDAFGGGCIIIRLSDGAIIKEFNTMSAI